MSLCPHHVAVLNAALRLEHLDDAHVAHNLALISQQCPACRESKP